MKPIRPLQFAAVLIMVWLGGSASLQAADASVVAKLLPTDSSRLVNEVSMIVSPTWFRLSRTYVDRGYCAIMRRPSGGGPNSILGTLGHVYLAYIGEATSGQENIHFWRRPRLDGVDAWEEQIAFQPPAGHSLNGTRIDVSPSTGMIFLSWLDWTDNTVHVMTSTDRGVSWSAPQPSNVAEGSTEPESRLRLLRHNQAGR